MSEYQNVKLSIEARAAIITIDHPPANAFDTQTVMDLDAALAECLESQEVKVIIITGAGQFFVAGADINEINRLKSYDDAYQVVRAGQELFIKVERSPKPIIAAINGRACLGGGNELAMACHIRLAEDSVQFGQPEVKLGIMPGWGGTQRLPRLVGKGRGFAVPAPLGNIKAQEAFRIGLVNKVVPVGSVVREAKRWARVLSMWGAVAMRSILQSVNDGLDMPLEAAIENEAQIFARLTETEDMREGVAAFLEKRRPKFQDK